MKKTFILIFLSIALLSYTAAFAVETAPRISDREIIEKLAKLEEGQKSIDKRFDDMNNSVNKRFDDMNRRFDTLQWMFGVFITIALFIMGFIVKMLWAQRKELAEIETSLETQKDEISFLKNLIEKLLPPKGVL